MSKKLATLSAMRVFSTLSFSSKDLGRLASISASDLTGVGSLASDSLTKETPSKRVNVG